MEAGKFNQISDHDVHYDDDDDDKDDKARLCDS